MERGYRLCYFEAGEWQSKDCLDCKIIVNSIVPCGFNWSEDFPGVMEIKTKEGMFLLDIHKRTCEYRFMGGCTRSEIYSFHFSQITRIEI